MQCQSCGTNVKTGIKQCPTCGEEVTAAFTTNLPRQASSTGPVDYSSVVNSTSPDVLTTASAPEAHLNGKQVESAPFPSRPIAPPPSAPIMPPSTPIMSAIGRDREVSPDTSRPEPALSPTDIIRPGKVSCRRCQRELKVGAKFCSTCGTSIEPSFLDKALTKTRFVLERAYNSLQVAYSQSTIPLSTVLLCGVAVIFVLAAMIQYLIPIGVDAGSTTQVIFHLRSIEFLLVALIFMIASLVIKKR